MRKHYKNAVGGVVLAAIQITVDSDLSAERTTPPRSTHVQPGDISSFLIQQGRGEVEGELQQHDDVVAMELVVLRQGFAKHYGGGGDV